MGPDQKPGRFQPRLAQNRGARQPGWRGITRPAQADFRFCGSEESRIRAEGRRRSTGRHQPLRRRPQPAVKALRLDRRSRQNHRRRRTRAPGAGVNPLTFGHGGAAVRAECPLSGKRPTEKFDPTADLQPCRKSAVLPCCRKRTQNRRFNRDFCERQPVGIDPLLSSKIRPSKDCFGLPEL